MVIQWRSSDQRLIIFLRRHLGRCFLDRFYFFGPAEDEQDRLPQKEQNLYNRQSASSPSPKTCSLIPESAEEPRSRPISAYTQPALKSALDLGSIHLLSTNSQYFPFIVIGSKQSKKIRLGKKKKRKKKHLRNLSLTSSISSSTSSEVSSPSWMTT